MQSNCSEEKNTRNAKPTIQTTKTIYFLEFFILIYFHDVLYLQGIYFFITDLVCVLAETENGVLFFKTESFQPRNTDDVRWFQRCY